MTQKKLWSFFLGILISGAFLYVIFRNVQISELTAALKSANYWWLIPNLFFVILAMFQRAERWKHMLKPIIEMPYKKLLSATCIGFMANNVLPLRLGEFVRAYSLARNEKRLTKSASLATIFVERMVFDLLALLMILSVLVFLIPTKFDDRLKLGAALSLGIAIAGLLFAIVILLKPEGTGRLIGRYLFFLPLRAKEYISSTIVKFSRGLLFLKNWKHILWVSGHTLFIWLFMGISNIFVFYAFGFDLPIYVSYFLLIVVSISILIPSAPGFVGVYHAGAVWALTYFDVDSAEAISCALVLHAAQFVPITVMGFYYVWKEGLSLKQLEKEAGEKNDNELK